jgi:Tol biopolymer transport system component
VIYAQSGGTGHIGIFRTDLTTGKVASIPDSDGLFSPRVSPDGRYISAFTRDGRNLMLFDTSTNHWSSLVEGEEVSYNEWSHD